MSSSPAVLSLGSNLGDRLAYLRGGVEVVAARLGVQALSPVYETQPVGGPPQPPYLNAVLLTRAPSAAALLAVAREAEARAGRVRGGRFGPRTLDVDVVSYDELQTDEPELTLPHPRAAGRAFVLAPWLDLAPDAVVPGSGRVAELLQRVGRAGVRRRDDLRLTGSW